MIVPCANLVVWLQSLEGVGFRARARWMVNPSLDDDQDSTTHKVSCNHDHSPIVCTMGTHLQALHNLPNTFQYGIIKTCPTSSQGPMTSTGLFVLASLRKHKQNMTSTVDGCEIRPLARLGHSASCHVRLSEQSRDIGSLLHPQFAQHLSIGDHQDLRHGMFFHPQYDHRWP